MQRLRTRAMNITVRMLGASVALAYGCAAQADSLDYTAYEGLFGEPVNR